MDIFCNCTLCFEDKMAVFSTWQQDNNSDNNNNSDKTTVKTGDQSQRFQSSEGQLADQPHVPSHHICWLQTMF